MKVPRFKRTLRLRMNLWQASKVIVGLLIVAGAGSFAGTVHPRLSMFAAGLSLLALLLGFPLLVKSFPRRWRWLAGNVLTLQARDTPSITEEFEIDLPCARCGAQNIGVEAGMLVGERRQVRFFRTCEPCGHTQWWVVEDRPPRVRRRQRVTGLPGACPACKYDLTGVPTADRDLDAGKRGRTRQCPECGRTELFVLPAVRSAVGDG